MNELPRLALNAHGGIDRWSRLDTVAIDPSIGEALWDLKGHAGLFAAVTYANSAPCPPRQNMYDH
jgi:hypothetical protein